MSSAEKIKLGELLGYPYIECDKDIGIAFLNKLSERLGYSSEDLRDSIRILNNYEEFYSYAQRKGKEFIVPSKRESDFIRGRVVVDKIKLLGDNKVIILFDRRFKREYLEEIIRELR
ncbi:MAG: hypothetical protein ABWJ42_00410 [Sulfolobales archaeon]